MSGRGSILVVGFELGGQFEEQAKSADFDCLLHDVHTVQIVHDNGLEDVILFVADAGRLRPRMFRKVLKSLGQVEDGLSFGGPSRKPRIACMVAEYSGSSMLRAANRNAPEPQAGSRTEIFVQRVPHGAYQFRAFAVDDDVPGETLGV